MKLQEICSALSHPPKKETNVNTKIANLFIIIIGSDMFGIVYLFPLVRFPGVNNNKFLFSQPHTVHTNS